MQAPVASQQPPGHEVASHTHVPVPLHSCPCLQPTQAAPLTPHAAFVGVTQLPVTSQQPLGHEAASQMHPPSPHAWPGGQVTHAAAPVPHAAEVSAVTQ
jgi:hypothetical protein